MNDPLSNYDLLAGLMKEMKERGNIFDMREIENADTIEDVFSYKGHTILFEPSEDPTNDVGHWTCLIRNHRNGGNIIFFDSFGDKLKNKRLRQILGDNYKFLEFNPNQFQDYGKSAVCGRYALLCVALNKIIKDLSIFNIVDFLTKGKPKNKSYVIYIVFSIYAKIHIL